MGSVSGVHVSVFPTLHIVPRDLDHGAQVLPAEGDQEHGAGQVQGQVLASGYQLAAGKVMRADHGDELRRLVEGWVRVGGLLIDLGRRGRVRGGGTPIYSLGRVKLGAPQYCCLSAVRARLGQGLAAERQWLCHVFCLSHT